MRYTQVLIYAALLLVALVAAYMSWTHEPPGGKGDVVVIDADARQLQAVVYEEEDHTVRVTRREGGDDGICWGDTRKLSVAPRTPDKVPPVLNPEGEGDDDSAEPASEEPEEEPEKIEEIKSFRGNKTCDKILGRFAPMKAIREFELLTDEKLAEMELTEPVATLKVTTARGERSFEVGGRSYGTNDYYLRDASSGSVFLVESRVIADIKGGSTRLMERSVFDFKKEDAESAQVAVGSNRGSFVQLNRDDSKTAFWAAADDTSRAHDAADTLLNKALRLRALSYLTNTPAGLQPMARVEFAGVDESLGWLEIGMTVDSEGAPIHVVRSSHTSAWVEVSDTMGADVVDGLTELFPS
ncbi:MAG: DUF4340 domain-containing protein [Myxococcota bacterium]|nr:DUF4340 domain-containing protein [Myxococcota bacterium]